MENITKADQAAEKNVAGAPEKNTTETVEKNAPEAARCIFPSPISADMRETFAMASISESPRPSRSAQLRWKRQNETPEEEAERKLKHNEQDRARRAAQRQSEDSAASLALRNEQD
ncbi:hypothetical protein L596_003467 [Steinernema carpocapsae]|uniref:Uncharacterized protein n=1 Tax=Steinernema carpocapsae TaxID=34508 RepID=A0A4U8UWP0_STECR|nr:hypothetical protein L596_003467 [Steinernema carpocapsae]